MSRTPRPRPRPTSAHRLPRHPLPTAALTLILLAFAPAALARQSPTSNEADSLALVERHIEQTRVPFERARDHQKCWVVWRVDYLLRNEGQRPIELSASAVSAELEGQVSNARVPCHAIPRRLAHGLSPSNAAHGLTLESVARLVESADDTRDCSERARLELVPLPPNQVAPAPPAGASGQGPLAPGQFLRARLELEHQHFLYGPYDPLLGRRELTLRVGPATFRDELPLDRPPAEVFPPCTWGPPPPDRLDPRIFVSSPDSLRLSASRPGHYGYDYPERPVRYDTPMKLSFWYLVAPGLDGRFQFEIKQYRDAPRSYRALPDGRIAEDLCEVGHWVQVQRVFRTDPQATTVRLRFSVDSDTGEGDAWIDDVVLEPLAARPDRP